MDERGFFNPSRIKCLPVMNKNVHSGRNYRNEKTGRVMCVEGGAKRIKRIFLILEKEMESKGN